jgi:hypothetical protein
MLIRDALLSKSYAVEYGLDWHLAVARSKLPALKIYIQPNTRSPLSPALIIDREPSTTPNMDLEADLQKWLSLA